MAVVVDTNVPMVADDLHGAASEKCRDECVLRLLHIMRSGGLLLDESGFILEEYLGALGHSGRPGIGSGFVKWAHINQFSKPECERILITSRQARDWRFYEEFPMMRHCEALIFPIRSSWRWRMQAERIRQS